MTTNKPQITCPYCKFIMFSDDLQKHGDRLRLVCQNCENKFEVFLHDKPFICYEKLFNPKLNWIFNT
jgi:transcription elongation factor Elf1